MTPAQTSHLRAAIVALVGLLVLAEASRYDIGTMRHMGPGFFPIALGGLLVALGVLLFFEKQPIDEDTEEVPFQLRPFICVCLAIALFALLIDRYGLIPASFASVATGALGDRRNGPLAVLLLAAGFATAAVLIFSGVLGLSFPLVRWS